MIRAPRIVRLSVGTLLAAEREATKRLTKAIQSSIADAAADVARKQRDDRRAKAAALALILMHSKQMASKAHDAILAGRQHARAESGRRSLAELAALGVVVSGALGGSSSHKRDEDDAHATGSADSLAVAWRGLAFVAVSKALREETDPAKALRLTDAPMKHRIKRTSVTETAQAYGDAHRTLVRDASERDDVLAARLSEAEVVEVWSALVDACELCVPHDGEQVAIGDFFSGGDEPGSVHAHCRCVSYFSTVAAERRLAA